MAQRSILIIDGNSWMHRAFHAIQTPLTAPDGRPTNAAFGFFSIFNKVVETLKPDIVVAAFDEGKPAFRLEALEQYKVHRPPTDPHLKAQFPMVEELLKAINVPVVRIKNWEGDDILGTVAEQAQAQGMRVYLATGDRDAYQLVNESVSVVSSKVGAGSDIVVVGPADVYERYGVHPHQVIDYLGLKGDPSDNIPGVPGIGEKTASKLLQDYGTLEAVLDAAARGEIKGRAGANLVEYEGAARASRTVATIMRDVPIDLPLDDVAFGEFNVATATDAFMALRLRAPLTKLMAFGRKNSVESSTAPRENIAPSAVTSEYTVAQWAQSGETLFDAHETLLTGNGSPDSFKLFQDEAAQAEFCRLVSDQRVSTLDFKSALSHVYPTDSSLPAVLDVDAIDTKRVFDISLATYLLESARSDYSLSGLANDYLGIDLATCCEGETAEQREVFVLASLTESLRDALKKDESLELYETIELPLLRVLARLERTGIALDSDFLKILAEEGRRLIDALRIEIYELAGKEFSIDSPKQLAEVLFVDLGLPPQKKKKTGYSTDASVLAELVPLHPIADKLMNYRELTKLQSTYIEALPRLTGGDGKVHTTFNQTVAATGRLSSSNPNLQNIPVRTEIGRRIRQAFVPSEPGWVLMSADYSQIELRVLAHLSGDAGLIEAFTNGQDFHAATAARVFGVEPEKVDTMMRSRAKAVNFGIVYGQGARALGLSLGISIAEAQQTIDRYYAAYPMVKSYLDSTIEFAIEHGWIATAFNRKRHIPELRSPAYQLREFGKRTAMNHPMQGTAADLIKIAMIAVDRRLREESFQARMLLQVHDELVFECPPDELERLSSMVKDAMAKVADFSVPLEVSISSGNTWADTK